MAKAKATSVDDYIASQPQTARAVLTRVRSTIRKALPKAEEGISYQIPVYRIAGRMVIYFAGWSGHYSLYPCGDRLAAAFKDELADYTISKGTIRFPLDRPVPVKLIAAIAKFKAKEAAARTKPAVAKTHRASTKE